MVFNMKLGGKIKRNINRVHEKDISLTNTIIKDLVFPNEYCVYTSDGILLYQTDCIDFMDRLIKQYPDGIFDMIFADPPYFLSNGGITCVSGKMVKVDKGDWDKSRGVDKNHIFNLEWLSRCQRLLKPTGSIWVSGTHHVIYSVGFAMQQLGFKILNDITWEKPNPPPNLSCRYFTHSTETIIWAAKNEKSRHKFNYDLVRKMNNNKQMKTVWTIYPPSNDEKRYGKHPTQKPLKLLERIILSSTDMEDLVFDPFSGSSTTGIAAIKYKRYFIGCEMSDEYIRLSRKRFDGFLNEARNTPLLFKEDL